MKRRATMREFNKDCNAPLETHQGIKRASLRMPFDNSKANYTLALGELHAVITRDLSCGGRERSRRAGAACASVTRVAQSFLQLSTCKLLHAAVSQPHVTLQVVVIGSPTNVGVDGREVGSKAYTRVAVS